MTGNGTARLWLEHHFLGEVAIGAGAYRPAVLARNTTIALDMVRATSI
jgi:hypothetical protein